MTRTLRIAIRTHVSLALAVACVLYLSRGGSSAASLLGGAAFALLNLGLWALLVRALVGAVAQKGPIRRGWLWLGVIGKMGAFAGLAGALLWKIPIDPLCFAGGVTLLTLGFFAAGLYSRGHCVAGGLRWNILSCG